MEKLKNFGLFEFALLGTLCRSFVVGPTLSDSLVIVALVAVLAFTKHYLNAKKINDVSKINEDINLLKNEVSTIKLSGGMRKTQLSSPMEELVNVRRF